MAEMRFIADDAFLLKMKRADCEAYMFSLLDAKIFAAVCDRRWPY